VIYIIRQTSTKEKEDPYLNAIPDVAEMTTVTNNGYTKEYIENIPSLTFNSPCIARCTRYNIM
jgi:hypothetical protein